MNVGGGLRYVSGPMGAGKTLYGVRHMVARLLSGRYVVTNIRLLDDAPERIARHTVRLARSKRELVEDKVRRYYVFETDLEQAMRYRPPGRGESRALFIWDEAHNDLNNRTWKGRDQRLLEWATQLRKLGYEGVLLTQAQDNTDAQLRRICNWHVRLQNQRESVRLLGMRLRFLPSLFLASWFMANTPHSSKLKPMLVERYFLGWHRHLYDTLELFHGLAAVDADELSDTIALPAGGWRPELRRGDSGALAPGLPAKGLDGSPALELLPTPRADFPAMTPQTERRPLQGAAPELLDAMRPRRAPSES